jgi:7-carboxy-7-deazaguanine synthase
MRIAETYKSIQGEGLLSGTESIFVRTSGCNLRCWFCDTPYASWRPEGGDLSVSEILLRVAEMDCSHVVLTGGEPMLFAELIPLCDGLRVAGHHITIETAGTLYLPIECDLMSISPKMSNSTPAQINAPQWHERHERTRHAPAVIHKLVNQYAYQFKFVIEQSSDLDELEGYLRRFTEIERSRVMLMPQGTDQAELEEKAAWLEPLCRERGFRYCPRRHIELFGLTRGT